MFFFFTIKFHIKYKINNIDFKEKEARARFTGAEIVLYNLNRLNINVHFIIKEIMKLNN